MTEAVTPLKIYEYLASGVPVVATPLPACDRHLAVATASGPGAFATRIDDALELATGQRLDLRGYAEPAAWEQRIGPLLDRLAGRGQRAVG